MEHLKYRPSSSLDTSSKSGVLRYVTWQDAQESEKTSRTPRAQRPYTAQPGSRQRQFEKSMPRVSIVCANKAYQQTVAFCSYQMNNKSSGTDSYGTEAERGDLNLM